MTSRVTEVGSEGLLNGPKRPISGRNEAKTLFSANGHSGLVKGGSMTRHNDPRSGGRERQRELAVGVGGTGRSKRIRGTTDLVLGQRHKDHLAQSSTPQVMEGRGSS